jgi:hypothetical protein
MSKGRVKRGQVYLPSAPRGDDRHRQARGLSHRAHERTARSRPPDCRGRAQGGALERRPRFLDLGRPADQQGDHGAWRRPAHREGHWRPLSRTGAHEPARGTQYSGVLNNYRHHGEDQARFARTWRVDPFSSGPLFFDWKELEDSPVLWPLRPTYQPLIVRRSYTWLLAKGWRQFHPSISLYEVPGP